MGRHGAALRHAVLALDEPYCGGDGHAVDQRRLARAVPDVPVLQLPQPDPVHLSAQVSVACLLFGCLVFMMK